MRLIQWLLDLENIQLGRDAPVALEWQAPWTPQAWMLVCLALAVVTWVTVVYRRERATLLRRLLPAGARCVVIALAVAVFCRPALVLQRDRVEPSIVALMLDTSMSMDQRDTYRDAEMARRIADGAGVSDHRQVESLSRFALVRNALTSGDDLPIRTLLARNAVQLATFDERLRMGEFAPRGSTPDRIVQAIGHGAPDGTSTDIAGALSAIMDAAHGRRMAGIVLVSDGAATQPGRLHEVLDEAAARQIPIYPVRIGSPDAPFDVAIESVLARQSVFIHDRLAVQARINTRGLGDPARGTDPTALEVHLIDAQTDAIVDTKQAIIAEPERSVTVELQVTPTRRGPASYRVEVPPRPGEATADNNAESIDVQVLHNELRVLYIEGYPRYEYRYLKNALLREKTIHLSVLLLEADDRFVQEGTEPIRAFPESPEALNRFDVVIFGDVDPRGGWLSAAQMNMLLDFVGNAGGGFALVAGERAAPQRFLGTPIEKLVPVRIDASFGGPFEGSLTSGFTPRLTREGRRGSLFVPAAGAEPEQAAESAGPAVTPLSADCYWYARTLGPTPGAAVLAEHPTDRTESGMMPIVVTGHYGAGKLFFQATDDSWRSRRGSGEFAHDTYWVQVARSLARGLRLAQTRRFTLRTDHATYPYAAPVRTNARVHDAQLLAGLGETIEVIAESIGDEGRATSDPPGDADRRFLLHRLGAGADEFEGAWIPPTPGRFELTLSEFTPAPEEVVPSVSVRVDRPDLESRSPQADHALLDRLAAASGGRVVDLNELPAALAEIPDRSIRTPDDVIEPLWDTRLVLALFALMISMEWVTRKAAGLL